MFLSIIIPAYNEEKRIRNTLEKIDGYINRKKIKAEIIVVNDGSKDNTDKVVSSWQPGSCRIRIINLSINRGKGHAVRTGVLSANGDFILFTDADLSTPIDELDNFLAYTNNHDVIIGSRRMTNSRILLKQPFYRRILGWFFQKSIAAFILEGYEDTQCGFKLFKKEAGIKIFQNQIICGFVFDVEVLLLARKLNYHIAEVPVKWLDNPATQFSFFKHFFSTLMDIKRLKALAALI